MDVTIVDLFHIVMKRIWLVIVVTVLTFTIALSYCVFVAKPVYSAKATVLIASGVLFKGDGEQSNSEYITTGELSTSFALLKSISGILSQSVEYYETAIGLAEEAGLNKSYTVGALKGCTSMSYEDESIILTITVRTHDKEDAATLVAALAECAPSTVTSRLGRTSAVVLNIDKSAVQVAPNTAATSMVALLGGFVLSVLAAVVINSLDKTVKGEDDFLKNHDVPLLGCVPDFENKGKRRTIE